MRRYHHTGIPTLEKREGEVYLKQFKMYASGYEVDNLEEEIAGKNIIIEPNSPSEGILVAFIEDNGAPVELLQYL